MLKVLTIVKFSNQTNTTTKYAFIRFNIDIFAYFAYIFMQTEQTTLSTQMIKLQKFILTKNNYSRRKINLNKFIFSKIGNLI